MKTVLRNHSVFQFVTDEQWEIFSSSIVREIYPKDAFFVKAGEFSSKVGFVESGLFRGFFVNGKGQIFTKEFIEEGHILGALPSIYRAIPTEYSYQAIEESAVLAFDFEILSELSLKHPCWETVKRLIAQEAFLRSELKQHNLHILSTKENLDFFAKNCETLKKRIPQFMLASYLGVSPVTLSRIANQDENAKKPK